jgi:methylmalonyl-CoA mutase cobalamin-binding subunit
VVCVGNEASSIEAAQKLTRSLGALGVETQYLGHHDDAEEIATLVAKERADTVELCMAAGASGVLLLRGLVRRLIEIARRDVSIVIHRIR